MNEDRVSAIGGGARDNSVASDYAIMNVRSIAYREEYRLHTRFIHVFYAYVLSFSIKAFGPNAMKKAMEKDALLTVSQAARVKGVTRTTIYNAIAAKRLPTIQVLGRIAIRESDLESSDVGRGKSGPPPGKPLSAKHRAALKAAHKKRRSRHNDQNHPDVQNRSGGQNRRDRQAG